MFCSSTGWVLFMLACGSFKPATVNNLSSFDTVTSWCCPKCILVGIPSSLDASFYKKGLPCLLLLHACMQSITGLVPHCLSSTNFVVRHAPCYLQDSWFNTLKLKLPAGAGYEIQMRYGRWVADLVTVEGTPFICWDACIQPRGM